LNLKPDYTYQNLESIPISIFVEQNIACILVDIDNTITSVDEVEIEQAKQKWLSDVQKHVRVILVSNNHGSRIQQISKSLSLETFSFALKPISRVYRYVKKKYNVNKKQVAVIGDQLLTDILGGKLQGFKTIYVEPISQKDTLFTTITRAFERMIEKKWN